MDVLSITASIIAILQVTTKVGLCLREATDVSADCKHFTAEITNLSTLLVALLSRIDESSQDPWHVQVKELGGKDGVVYQYRTALERLKDKITTGYGIKKITKTLLGKYVKDDAERILAGTERLKSLVQIALEMDHFALSQANHSMLTSIDESNQAIQAGVFNLQIHQDSSQQLAIMDWLSADDFPAQQLDHIQRRQEETGLWFLNAAEFSEWIQGSQPTLFCTGIPGAGKTMMAAIVVDYLQKQVQTSDIGVAYICCSYKRQEQQSTSSMLAAMLRQLVQDNPSIAKPVSDLHNAHEIRRTRPSADEIFGALRTVVGSYQETYLVIDALDECSDANSDRTKLLDKCFALLQQKGVHLMATARHISNIVENFKDVPRLEVRANPTDVKRYINGQVGRLPRCIQRDIDLQDRIQDRITDAVDGMYALQFNHSEDQDLANSFTRFLLARLHVDSLLDKRTKAKVLHTLENLTEGTKALEDAYHEAIIRIDSQLPEDSTLAKKVLTWISCAQRPLMVQELCHALAVEMCDAELNADNVPDIEDIVPVCAGLVIADEESQIIRLVHHTTQDYLEAIRGKWDPEAQYRIATTCLTYLCFRPFQSGPCKSDIEFETRLERNPLFDYAARYWAWHIITVQEHACEQAMSFFRQPNVIAAVQQACIDRRLEYDKFYDSVMFPSVGTTLHLAVSLGLTHLSRKVLDNSQRNRMFANAKDSQGDTALSLATKKSYLALLEVLIALDYVDLNCANHAGETPLMIALNNGRIDVAIMLLDAGRVDTAAKNRRGHTVLVSAIVENNKPKLAFLLGNDHVDLNARFQQGTIALIVASERGYEEVTRMFLDISRVDVDARCRDGRTALMVAAMKEHKGIVKMLLEIGDADVNAMDPIGERALTLVFSKPKIVELLLKTGTVHLNMMNRMGYTALTLAAKEGSQEVVKLLIDTGQVDLNMKDRYGYTALLFAAKMGHLEVLRLLLDTGQIDFDTRSDYVHTALSLAVASGRYEAVRTLLTHDAHKVVYTADLRYTLMVAKSKGQMNIVDLVNSHFDSLAIPHLDSHQTTI